MSKRIDALDVFLGESLVGVIVLTPSGNVVFSFDEDYIENPGRPTLSLFYKGEDGGLIDEARVYSHRLPPFFSNLLPEGDLRRYVIAQAGLKGDKEFALLGVLGEDLPGNVRVRAPDGDEWPPGEEPEQGGQGALRFSLAGVQLKFSAIMNTSGGLTIPTSGLGGDWIVKLPSASFAHVPENEYSMLELARMCGLDVPETRLVAVDSIESLPRNIDRIESNALAVKRFDRGEGGARVHMEDFAQVYGLYPAAKYDRVNYRSICEVLVAETGTQGVVEFTKRLVFNLLIGNADMHAKNWSLIYPDGVTPQIAPAYDFVSTIAYLEDDNMALSLTRGVKRFDALDMNAFRHFAQKAETSERLVMGAVEEMLDSFHDVWRHQSDHLPLTRRVREAINRHLASLKIRS